MMAQVPWWMIKSETDINFRVYQIKKNPIESKAYYECVCGICGEYLGGRQEENKLIHDIQSKLKIITTRSRSR
jgi:formylmethanofuran dehydrogenase subunit E